MRQPHRNRRQTQNFDRNESGDSLAHLLKEFVVLEALVDWHLALSLALLLDDLFYVFLVLGIRRRVFLLCLLLLLLSFSVMAALLLGGALLLLLLLLHLGLRVGVLVGRVILGSGRVVVLSMTDEI